MLNVSKNWISLWLLPAVLVLAGCNTTDMNDAVVSLGGGNLADGTDHRPLRVSVPFNPENARYVLKPGSSSISGNVSLVGRDGKQRPPDHGHIELWPVTPHTTDRINTRFEGEKLSRRQVSVVNADKRLAAYTRRTKLGPDGSFRFDHLAAGPYYLKAASAITTSTASTHSGMAYEKVNVRAGQSVQVTITGQ